MRLLNAHTLRFEEFHADHPQYAILSHTWGDAEVTLQEMLRLQSSDPESDPAISTVLRKSGYEKMLRCAERARLDGIDYFWADTCCIDKSSSAELQEAINSMYKWYQESKVCYAFLSDISSVAMTQAVGEDRNRMPQSVRRWNSVLGSDEDISQYRSSHISQMTILRTSKWFTRGWTLQELLAPRTVLFFDDAWNIIGTKRDLAKALEDITGIDSNIIKNRQGLRMLSVAKRMSWVARRETRREEDMAYCMLGIFGINMPMLYGEGSRAFIRLQEEIMKVSDDASLLAWGYSGQLDVGTLPPQDWNEDGLLATHPKQFAYCQSLEPCKIPTHPNNSFTMSQRGLQVSLPLVSDPTHRYLKFAVLSCGFGDDEPSSKRDSVRKISSRQAKGESYLICVPLLSWKAFFQHFNLNDGYREQDFARQRWLVPIAVPTSFALDAILSELCICRSLHDSRVQPLKIELSAKVKSAYSVVGIYPPQPSVDRFYSIGGIGGIGDLTEPSEEGRLLVSLKHKTRGTFRMVFFRYWLNRGESIAVAKSDSLKCCRVVVPYPNQGLQFMQSLMCNRDLWASLHERDLEDMNGEPMKQLEVFNPHQPFTIPVIFLSPELPTTVRKREQSQRFVSFEAIKHRAKTVLSRIAER